MGMSICRSPSGLGAAGDLLAGAGRDLDPLFLVGIGLRLTRAGMAVRGAVVLAGLGDAVTLLGPRVVSGVRRADRAEREQAGHRRRDQGCLRLHGFTPYMCDEEGRRAGGCRTSATAVVQLLCQRPVVPEFKDLESSAA